MTLLKIIMTAALLSTLADTAAAAESAADSPDVLLDRFQTLQADPHQASLMTEKGRERAQFCFRCHGEDGNSRRDYVPNLASQNPAYLFNQFEKFASGERENFVMSRLAPSLSADERIAVAMYFSALPVTVRTEQPAAELRGMHIYQALCFACHGDRGHGDQQYPRIAGQPFSFLHTTLMNFKAGKSSRRNSPMTAIVQNLSDEDLKAVATWVANMP